MNLSASAVVGDGIGNDGGTGPHKFAKDGELSYLGHHATWIFASSVHMARLLPTCWHIHLTFLSSSTTLTKIGPPLQTMKRK